MQVEELQRRLREWSTERAGMNTIKALRELERDIATLMEERRVQEDDRLSEMQIAVFNNLACLYEKRGKYRSSLYHLQIAQELENKYFTHKYQQQPIPLPALEKLATTYSNLSAVQSKLCNNKEALLNAEFAIQILSNHDNKDHRSLTHLYYNYSFLLDTVARYFQASRYANEGLRLARLHKQKLLAQKYETLLAGLKDKLAKREERKIKQLRKHIKGELGVVKTPGQVKEMLRVETESEEVSTPNLTTLKQYFLAEKRHIKPTSIQHRQRDRERHNSTYTTLNSQKRRNFSLTQHPLRTLRPAQDINKDNLQVELYETHRPKEPPKEKSDRSGPGMILHNRLEARLDYRIKSKRLRLDQENENFSRKNEDLAKILHRMNSSEEHS